MAVAITTAAKEERFVVSLVDSWGPTPVVLPFMFCCTDRVLLGTFGSN